MSSFLGSAQRGIADRRGTVFVLFSLFLPIAVAGFLGAMSLFSMSAGRADLQMASDAAANAILADLNAALALSAIPDALVVDVDKQARANAVVQNLLGPRNDISQITTSVTTTDMSITVQVSAQFQNTAGDLISLPLFRSSATTTVNWMRQDQLQIAMSIDSGVAAGRSFATSTRLALLKPLLLLTVDTLSSLPNYPNIGMAIVPFTAQVSADPAIAMADAAQDNHGLWAHISEQFVEASDDAVNWILPQANAAVTQCYSDPLIPKNVDGTGFLGTNRPLPQACDSPLVRLRPFAKISRPFQKGTPSASEAVNAPEKLAREDMKAAINAISPAGCRNLAMGVAWSMAQLPKDNNPKIIFLIANGNNSQSKRGRTAECAGAGPIIAQTQLDADFANACAILRDPSQNNGRVIDLFVLQFVEGNSLALKSCASISNGVSNYFSGTTGTLAGFFQSIGPNLHQIAKAQVVKRGIFEDKSKNEKSGRSDKSS